MQQILNDVLCVKHYLKNCETWIIIGFNFALTWYGHLLTEFQSFAEIEILGFWNSVDILMCLFFCNIHIGFVLCQLLNVGLDYENILLICIVPFTYGLFKLLNVGLALICVMKTFNSFIFLGIFNSCGSGWK